MIRLGVGVGVGSDGVGSDGVGSDGVGLRVRVWVSAHSHDLV